jgi:plastocyanin
MSKNHTFFLRASTTVKAFMVLAFVSLASCGGSGPAASIDIVMTDFEFTESEWLVPAGSEITINLDNQGSVIHNWSLVKMGEEISSEGDLPMETDDRDALYVAKAEVNGGESSSLTLPAPPAGVYQVICDIQPHFTLGMTGTLTVE